MRQSSSKLILASVLMLTASIVFASSPSVFDHDRLGQVKTSNTQTPPTLDTKQQTAASVPVLNPIPPTLAVQGYFLEDVYSGKELASFNADQKMPPASLTKLMTLYLTFEALQAGRIHMTDLVPISVNAWKTGGSRMFVKPGDQVRVSDLINGVIIQSGNDACMALAEYVGGTEDNFVNLMNQQAQLLGMKNTHYMDCTGLPNPNHFTTPRDLSTLAHDIITNFPNYYPLFAQKTYTYNRITQPNRNRLLWRDPSVDGLKTGHTDEAGFCLVASAVRNHMRLLSVILGAPTDEMRAQDSEALLNYGYRFYETHKIYMQNQVIEQVPLYYGKSNKLPVGVASDFYVTVPSGAYAEAKTEIKMQSPLKAPIQQGQKVGTVDVIFNGKQIAESDLIAMENVEKANIFSRGLDRIKLAMSKS